MLASVWWTRGRKTGSELVGDKNAGLCMVDQTQQDSALLQKDKNKVGLTVELYIIVKLNDSSMIDLLAGQSFS